MLLGTVFGYGVEDVMISTDSSMLKQKGREHILSGAQDPPLSVLWSDDQEFAGVAMLSCEDVHAAELPADSRITFRTRHTSTFSSVFYDMTDHGCFMINKAIPVARKPIIVRDIIASTLAYCHEVMYLLGFYDALMPNDVHIPIGSAEAIPYMVECLSYGTVDLPWGDADISDAVMLASKNMAVHDSWSGYTMPNEEIRAIRCALFNDSSDPDGSIRALQASCDQVVRDFIDVVSVWMENGSDFDIETDSPSIPYDGTLYNGFDKAMDDMLYTQDLVKEKLMERSDGKDGWRIDGRAIYPHAAYTWGHW
jgi:hypothetical protein